jgi:hypothetical protein
VKERKERKKTIVTLPQIIGGQVWRYKEVRDSKEKQPLLSFFLQATILLHISITMLLMNIKRTYKNSKCKTIMRWLANIKENPSKPKNLN